MALSNMQLPKPLTIQRSMGVVYTGMGLWCLLCPGQVLRLGLKEPLDSLPVKVLMGCFGSQACVSGLLLSTSQMSKRSWQLFALAMLPFYGFNYYFYFIKPVFTKWMLMDFVGNSIFLGGSLLAASQMPDEEEEKPKDN